MAAPTRTWLAGVFAVAMAITLTKFGNPIIFKALETPPSNIWEVLLATWPATWSYGVAAGLCFAAFATQWQRAKSLPLSVVALLGGWLFWAGLSMKNSVEPELSRLTVLHFGATVAAFFLAGAFLPTLRHAQTFFRIMIFALLFALWLGWDQHYGGLEATRRALYESGAMDRVTPEFKLKIASNRIFGPFVYPNAFAGAILIWAPVLMLALWEWTKNLSGQKTIVAVFLYTIIAALGWGGAPRLLILIPIVALAMRRWIKPVPIVHKVIVGLSAYAAVSCFFWTGSKAGWLIAIAVFVVGLLHLKNLNRNAKIGIIVTVVVCGLAGFAVKNRAYFEKGATSASARVIYWRAALQVANEHPILGAGPGTFAKTFAPIKPPEAEMARLVHNDYLEQACDSGWPAFILFCAFIVSAMFVSHKVVTKSPYHLAAWLGLVGWSLQSFVEFGLYIPAISWSAFVLLGWLLASRFEIDTPKPAK